MKKKPWSNADLLTLGDLYRDGKSYNEIAVKLNRTKGAVAYAINQYRDVINVDYRSEGAGRVKIVASEQKKKPWWAFWRV